MSLLNVYSNLSHKRIFHYFTLFFFACQLSIFCYILPNLHLILVNGKDVSVGDSNSGYNSQSFRQSTPGWNFTAICGTKDCINFEETWRERGFLHSIIKKFAGFFVIEFRNHIIKQAYQFCACPHSFFSYSLNCV